MKQNYQRKKQYNKLYEENIIDKNYTRINIIWKHFNIKNLGEYHNLIINIYLLINIFRNFRDICINYYELDPTYFYYFT